MIEEMETYLMGRSIDGIRTSGRSTVVPVQSRILSLLCMFSILLSYYKISRLHLSGICVNTHTHTHNSGALYYKLFLEYQRIGGLFPANLSSVYFNISSLLSCSCQNRITELYPSAAGISKFPECLQQADRAFLEIK